MKPVYIDNDVLKEKEEEKVEWKAIERKEIMFLILTAWDVKNESKI